MRVTVTTETTDLTRQAAGGGACEPSDRQTVHDRRKQTVARSVVGGKTRRFGGDTLDAVSLDGNASDAVEEWLGIHRHTSSATDRLEA